jgi:hypothetical protein
MAVNICNSILYYRVLLAKLDRLVLLVKEENVEKVDLLVLSDPLACLVNLDLLVSKDPLVKKERTAWKVQKDTEV